ncbi:MAG: SRPBCC family protein [Gemmatimonadaceae bacterium]
MSDIASIRSFHVVVDAPPEAVFDFVNDLNNMPRWSIHFCKGIRVIPGDGAIVNSPAGEVYFGITGDRDLGILDWWSGPTMESAVRWPTRVVGLPDGRSLYQVTALLSATEAAMPNLEQIFADELGMLKQLVELQLQAA